MGQKSSRALFAADVTNRWFSSWFASGKTYAKYAVEDYKIRSYLSQFSHQFIISSVAIARVGRVVNITLNTGKASSITSKPEQITAIKKRVEQITGCESNIDIASVKKPELDARIAAIAISAGISSGKSYKKCIKYAMDVATKNGAKGVKIIVSGRLNGAEIARSEPFKTGSIPLHTIRADIDYACETALTKYGIIGIKVWINRSFF